MSEYIMDLVEMIESEFPKKSWDELNELVMEILENNKNFYKLNKESKFDYLVDSILMMNESNK